jgi:hypothetical protein
MNAQMRCGRGGGGVMHIYGKEAIRRGGHIVLFLLRTNKLLASCDMALRMKGSPVKWACEPTWVGQPMKRVSCGYREWVIHI